MDYILNRYYERQVQKYMMTSSTDTNLNNALKGVNNKIASLEKNIKKGIFSIYGPREAEVIKLQKSRIYADFDKIIAESVLSRPPQEEEQKIIQIKVPVKIWDIPSDLVVMRSLPATIAKLDQEQKKLEEEKKKVEEEQTETIRLLDNVNKALEAATDPNHIRNINKYIQRFENTAKDLQKTITDKQAKINDLQGKKDGYEKIIEDRKKARKEAEEAERKRKEAEAKEAERKRKEAEEAERKRKEAEAEEAEKKRKEAEEAEKKRKEAEESEKKRKEAEESEKKRKEAEAKEAERKRKEEEAIEKKKKEAEDAEKTQLKELPKVTETLTKGLAELKETEDLIASAKGTPAEIGAAKAKADAIKKTLEAPNTEFIEITNKLAGARSELVETGDINVVNDIYARMDTEIRSVNKDPTKMSEDEKKIHKETTDTFAKMVTLTNQALNENNDAKKPENAAQKAQLTEKFNKTMQDLKSATLEAIKVQTKYMHTFGSIESKLKEAEESRKKAAEELENKRKKEIKDKFGKEKRSMQEEQKTLQEDETQLQQKVDTAEKALNEMDETLTKLKDRQTAEGNTKRAEELEKEISDTRAELKKTENEAANAIMQLNETRNKLNTIKDMEAKYEALIVTAAKPTEEMKKELKQKIDEEKKKIEEEKKKIEEAQTKSTKIWKEEEKRDTSLKDALKNLRKIKDEEKSATEINAAQQSAMGALLDLQTKRTECIEASSSLNELKGLYDKFKDAAPETGKERRLIHEIAASAESMINMRDDKEAAEKKLQSEHDEIQQYLLITGINACDEYLATVMTSIHEEMLELNNEYTTRITKELLESEEEEPEEKTYMPKPIQMIPNVYDKDKKSTDAKEILKDKQNVLFFYGANTDQLNKVLENLDTGKSDYWAGVLALSNSAEVADQPNAVPLPTGRLNYGGFKSLVEQHEMMVKGNLVQTPVLEIINTWVKKILIPIVYKKASKTPNRLKVYYIGSNNETVKIKYSGNTIDVPLIGASLSNSEPVVKYYLSAIMHTFPDIFYPIANDKPEEISPAAEYMADEWLKELLDSVNEALKLPSEAKKPETKEEKEATGGNTAPYITQYENNCYFKSAIHVLYKVFSEARLFDEFRLASLEIEDFMNYLAKVKAVQDGKDATMKNKAIENACKLIFIILRFMYDNDSRYNGKNPSQCTRVLDKETVLFKDGEDNVTLFHIYYYIARILSRSMSQTVAYTEAQFPVPDRIKTKEPSPVFYTLQQDDSINIIEVFTSNIKKIFDAEREEIFMHKLGFIEDTKCFYPKNNRTQFSAKEIENIEIIYHNIAGGVKLDHVLNIVRANTVEIGHYNLQSMNTFVIDAHTLHDALLMSNDALSVQAYFDSGYRILKRENIYLYNDWRKYDTYQYNALNFAKTEYFNIAIKRFSSNAEEQKRLKGTKSTDTITIDLNLTIDDIKFKLVSFMYHIGASIDSGHYVSVVNYGGVWYEYDYHEPTVVKEDFVNYNPTYTSQVMYMTYKKEPNQNIPELTIIKPERDDNIDVLSFNMEWNVAAESKPEQDINLIINNVDDLIRSAYPSKPLVPYNDATFYPDFVALQEAVNFRKLLNFADHDITDKSKKFLYGDQCHYHFDSSPYNLREKSDLVTIWNSKKWQMLQAYNALLTDDGDRLMTIIKFGRKKDWQAGENTTIYFINVQCSHRNKSNADIEKEINEAKAMKNNKLVPINEAYTDLKQGLIECGRFIISGDFNFNIYKHLPKGELTKQDIELFIFDIPFILEQSIASRQIRSREVKDLPKQPILATCCAHDDTGLNVYFDHILSNFIGPFEINTISEPGKVVSDHRPVHAKFKITYEEQKATF